MSGIKDEERILISTRFLKLANTANEDIFRKFSKRVVFVVPKSTKAPIKKSVAEQKNLLVKVSESFLYGSNASESKLVRSPQKDIVRFSK